MDSPSGYTTDSITSHKSYSDTQPSPCNSIARCRNTFNRKRRKTSDIWYFFTTIDQEVASCNICKHILSYKSTTSNLRKHLLTKHPFVSLPVMAPIMTSKCNRNKDSPSSYLKEIDSDPDEPDIIDNTKFVEPSAVPLSVSSTSSEDIQEHKNGTSSMLRSKYSQQQTDITSFMPKKFNIKAKKQIDEKLLQLFIKDFQPFRIVEDQGFKEFVKALNPMYQLPSRFFISRTAIPALYEEYHKLTKELINSGSSFCLTTDCWTSRNVDSYIALTAHFINNNFELTSFLLECAVMHTNHTSQHLAFELKRIANEWNIENKIILVVSDNASNIKNALSKELGWKHFGCFAHTLNLIVNDALHTDAIKEILDKVKSIVAHFKRSYVSNEKFMTFQKNNGNQPLKLIQDVATRWNSTYFMLERFSKLEIAICSTIALLDQDLPIITIEEWNVIKELCEILKPFEEVTKTISGEKYCTASLVIPLTSGLQNVCTALQKKNFSSTALNVISILQKGLNVRLCNVENSGTLLVCTFLDPRFKGLAFSKIEIAEYAKKLVISLLSNNIDKSESERTYKIRNQKGPSEQTKENELSVWYTFDKTITITKPKGTCKSKALIEIQRYIDDVEILPRQQDPIQWWKENTQYFPNLSNVAKQYLCVLGTSVPCERLFSKASLFLSDRRNRLNEKKTKTLLFLNTNVINSKK